MGKLINKKNTFEEGEVYFRWENSRIGNNKNVICVTTGPTGSGKSMCDLRRAELTYKRRFNKEFPVETNCCFSIVELMRRISSGDLNKGEVIILEEAGFNAGSQDWQHKTTKMFNYLLQTFRSMNICLYMNLPVLSMLAKQARQLIHIHFETQGIDFEGCKLKTKALVHQLNQQSGKSYWKYLRIRQTGKIRRVERMYWGLPCANTRQKYEAKKAKFLSEMTKEFVEDLEKKEKQKLDKMARGDLTKLQLTYYNHRIGGKSQKETCLLMNIDQSQGSRMEKAIKKKGYDI